MILKNKPIPQILTLAKVTKTLKVNLKKKVRQYLGIEENARLYMDTKHEIVISSKKLENSIQLQLEKNSIQLQREVWEKIQTVKDSLVGLVERDQAVAIKSFEIEKRQGEQARWYDIETPTKITRVVETNPKPETFLNRLCEKSKNLKLHYDVRSFIQHRQTLDSLSIRKILGMPHLSDEKLKQDLIRDRLDKQQNEGCWENSVPLTARNLRELVQLGMDLNHRQIKKAAAWLLARPQSSFNPGLWFATDDLIREQKEVIERRKLHTGKGTKERFKRAKCSEESLVRAGDPIIVNPCGARIMWTSALVLEALLMMSLEKEKRIQTAFRTLLTNPHWCDNTYQHGFTAWKRKNPLKKEELEKMEKYMLRQYEYGGLSSSESFFRPEVFEWFDRISSKKTSEGMLFQLKMPLGIGEGCRVFMVRALCNAKNELLRKIIEFNLWQFSANLNITDEIIQKISQRHFNDQSVFLLQIFSRINHPVAKLAIVRMLPWLLKIQNKDGSWGKEPAKDAITRAVVEAFLSLGEYIPHEIQNNLPKTK